MHDEVNRWLLRRSWSVADRPVRRLLTAKRAAGRAGTVSVVLPALNEEATVGDIVRTIRADLMHEVPLVDEVLVVDSGSTDGTREVARAAGARVVTREELLPHWPVVPGKGEVLWRSLLAARGEIICFVDSDLRDFSSDFVTGIIGPLLTETSAADGGPVHFVKAMYDRPLEQGGSVEPAGGGRVTELVARPLINLYWPRLAGFVQPLGGEYAARRSLLEQLPFPCGYGVELGLLVDTLHAVGLDAMAQVDVGVRRHRHQDGQALGRMAATIHRTAVERQARLTPQPRRIGTGPDGGLTADLGDTLVQFDRVPGQGFRPKVHAVAADERPPMVRVPEYLAHRRSLEEVLPAGLAG
ncbi:glucosyl-3-phosphoglycerate synthase [Allostreptomyces psammosilenae]|uniref:Glucosyl-3-phosphoglycerate synthase n=1 Tax=Allostreptomyces psammosilenae TaxID=1892865 RepID=A0A852ZZQ5_9ACTN|nr:glucosyl-3-phosphoglycerate synthase [Allostreptomyces psammosilenae]NYI07629.1 glucosyl-3-phosphoglycerate synthase [Allostreptomyces psammosilenae]